MAVMEQMQRMAMALGAVLVMTAGGLACDDGGDGAGDLGDADATPDAGSGGETDGTGEPSEVVVTTPLGPV